MSVKLFRVIVPVPSITAAAAFYEQVLAIAGKRVSPGRHYFQCGAVILACFSPREDGDDCDLPANPEHLYFTVDDLEGVFARCRGAGCRRLDSQIQTRPWGERSFYAQDPFGNSICFVDERTTFTGAKPANASILVVTGASGVGKSAAVAALEARALPGLECFYFDSIGVPSPEVIERDFGSGERWQAHATKQWIERLSSSAGVKVLDGQTRPSFVRAALADFPGARVQVALLDCESSVRAARLVARGQAELASPQLDPWAAYLRGQADALQLPVIDTTHASVEQVASELALLAQALR